GRSYFFFRAEDGIRDRNVTGVQTCALPISEESWVGGSALDNRYGSTGMSYKQWNSSLTAKKSWFTFENEIIALGAGISSDEDREDRKSTRLNSSHVSISYAVFCLKKKKKRR